MTSSRSRSWTFAYERADPSLALLSSLFLVNCVTLNREQPRTVITADGQYARAIDVDRGCEGEETFVQHHRQIGGSAKLRAEGRQGILGGGHLGLLHARPTKITGDDAGDQIDTGNYGLMSAGAWLGYDFRSIGWDVGLSGITRLDNGDVEVLPMPFLRFKLGDLNSQWGEAQLGSDEPLWYANILSFGAVGQGKNVRGRGGLTLYGRYMRDVRRSLEDEEDERLYLGTVEDDSFGLDPDTGLYADIEWLVDHQRGVGLCAGAVVGEQYSGRLGFVWIFDTPRL